MKLKFFVDEFICDVDTIVIDVVSHGDHAGAWETVTEATSANLGVDVVEKATVNMVREDLRIGREDRFHQVPFEV